MAKNTARRFRTLWELRPFVDLLPATVSLLLWLLVPWFRDLPGSWRVDASAITAFLTGVAGLAGVGVTLSTFAATMTYTSSDSYVRLIRKKFGNQLARNWITVLSGLLVCAAVAIVATVLVPVSLHIAAGLGLWASLASGMLLARGLFWLSRFWWAEENSSRMPTRHL